MCVNNLPKVATQRNSGATRDSNRGRRVLIPSALTTTPPSRPLDCVVDCVADDVAVQGASERRSDVLCDVFQRRDGEDVGVRSPGRAQCDQSLALHVQQTGWSDQDDYVL